nr:hypothetical protein GCM10017745_47790 [Saccharothrix mutabilis subsp. capreolus]
MLPAAVVRVAGGQADCSRCGGAVVRFAGTDKTLGAERATKGCPATAAGCPPCPGSVWRTIRTSVNQRIHHSGRVSLTTCPVSLLLSSTRIPAFGGNARLDAGSPVVTSNSSHF